MLTAEEFWLKVDVSGDCWLWTGAKAAHGYGHLFWNGKYPHAHRVAWELHYGDSPGEFSVLHRCDVPACVRPDHLFLGTQADNMRDMVDKGRHGGKARTHCQRGHALTDDNIYTSGRNRCCRRCVLDRGAERRSKA